jgi:hypothetical protein
MGDSRMDREHTQKFQRMIGNHINMNIKTLYLDTTFYNEVYVEFPTKV